MRAKLTFDLPDDRYEYNRANKALEMVIALYDIGNYLRDVYKYQDPQDDIGKIRDRFHDILLENNIIIEDLME